MRLILAPPVPITTFEGAPGEANRVGVSRAGGDFVVRDDGAALTAEAPCTAVDEHSVRCPVTEGFQGLHGFAALLGDGDDTLAIAGDMRVETALSGGDGKDVIEGSEGNDAIDGGPGDDRLLGGGGHDELSYATRVAAVTADLARETGGEAGEADGVGGFEVLVGGRGADVLRGAAGAEVIDGGAGDDVVRGRGGNDELFGGIGADRLSGDGGRGDDLLQGGVDPDRMLGGAGADTVFARGGGRDRVVCGSGRDVARTDRRDTRRSCELGRTSTAAG
jgi:Ca2+-binding RTX toxin-like protein